MGQEPTAPDLVELLARWFDHGDELALRRAQTQLEAALQPTRQSRDVLGEAIARDICRDLITDLLDHASGQLRDAAFPMAYAKSGLRNALVSALRKWGPREGRAFQVEEHMQALGSTITDHERVEINLDAEAALRVANSLSPKGRMAILLTTRPSRITDDDWSTVVARHPPPPPARPLQALDRDEAVALLYPATPNESQEARDQRFNTFDHAYKRALKDIRKKLEESP